MFYFALAEEIEANMDILRLYYTRILRLYDIIPMLKDKCSDDQVLKKLCSTTVFCCNESNGCEIFKLQLLTNGRRQNVPENLPTAFVVFLRDVKACLTSNDAGCIFRFSKLKSTYWKTLHKLCGDYVLRRLFASFDVFKTCAKEKSFTQLVGYPLNLRYSHIDSVSIKNKDRKSLSGLDRKFVSRKKGPDDLSTFSARLFMYSRDLRESAKRGLHKFWTASSGDDNRSSSLEMVQNVFGAHSAFVLDDVAPLFTDLIKRYERNRFRGLLDRYCPLPVDYANLPLKVLAEQYITVSKIRSYVRSLLFKVIPVELMGCKNLRIFVDRMSDKIVEFRRYDICNLRHFVDSFKSKDCSWIRYCNVGHALKHNLVVSLFQFLLRFVVHLIRKSFYVTESQCLKNKLLFYRKPLWSCIVKRGSEELIKRCQLCRIKKSIFKNKASTIFGPFGFRFVPKYGSVRPIVANYDNEHRVEKTNNSLKPVVAIMKYLLANNSALSGSAVASFDDIYKKWKTFIAAKRFDSSRTLRQPLYFVKVDVNACFDSILQTVLIDILENSLQPCMDLFYSVQHCCTVSLKNGKIVRLYRHLAWPIKCRPKRLEKQTISKKRSIFIVKNERRAIISRFEVLNTLKTLITDHVVKVLHKFYRQGQGIAQGSAVSKILCDLYLAQLEQRHVTYSDETDLLMRHVDDFLFVTPTKWKAVEFLKTLLTGVPEFGICSSPDKVVTNFHDDQLSDWFLITDGNKRGIPWCGLTFLPSTGEIYIDDNRWRVLDVRDSLTVNYGANANVHVEAKLVSYLSARAFRICFDSEINSDAVVKRNVNALVRFAARCYDNFKFAYGPKRLKLTPEEIGSVIARKMFGILASYSPTMPILFTIKGLRTMFCASLNR